MCAQCNSSLGSIYREPYHKVDDRNKSFPCCKLNHTRERHPDGKIINSLVVNSPSEQDLDDRIGQLHTMGLTGTHRVSSVTFDLAEQARAQKQAADNERQKREELEAAQQEREEALVKKHKEKEARTRFAIDAPHTHCCPSTHFLLSICTLCPPRKTASELHNRTEHEKVVAAKAAAAQRAKAEKEAADLREQVQELKRRGDETSSALAKYAAASAQSLGYCAR